MSSTSISISDKLRETEQLFSEAGIPSPRLDAEVLLAHALGVTRPYLHAHTTDCLQGGTLLQGASLQQFERMVERRLQREPVAYITGKKEFYGREFTVTPDVLIPRPETEALVELTLSEVEGRRLKGEGREANSERTTSFLDTSATSQQRSATKKQLAPSGVERKDGGSEQPYEEYNRSGKDRNVLDAGSGSGCIGITLKLERPELNVTLCDISPKALAVAKKNAKKLDAHVEFVESDLLSHFVPSKIQNLKSKIFFDCIVANLPYVDETWETSPETAHEPSLALYAKDGGLKLIKKLIEQSADVLNDKGLLLLEADPEQHAAIIKFASLHGFMYQKTNGYALGFMKLPQA